MDCQTKGMDFSGFKQLKETDLGKFTMKIMNNDYDIKDCRTSSYTPICKIEYPQFWLLSFIGYVPTHRHENIRSRNFGANL
jgi:hypothetical protein